MLYERFPVTDDRLIDSIDYFLVEISGKIQLIKTQREKVEGHYQAIANVLKESPKGTLLHELDIKMKPFGGLGSNTAARPFKKDEFDLDVIVQFLATTDRFKSPDHLFWEVFNRLNGHETYRDRIERKKRCIRISYAGEFCLDLMPAALHLPFDAPTKIWVPEEQPDGTYKFVPVHPLGLMEWFEGRCKLERTVVKNLAERADFEVMPLISEEARKPKLKQAVQLIKRARDVYFYNDDDCKKILKSVIILTVAGNCYAGESNLYALVDKIMRHIDAETMTIHGARIENPVHAEEDYLQSLKNKPERHEKLRQFITDFRKQWSDLAAPNKGQSYRQNLLNKMFGEKVAQEVLSEYATRMDEINKSGQMRMASAGTLIVSSAQVGTKVPRHEFFGD